MGDWSFPKHYTPCAKDYHKAVRKAEIEIFMDQVYPSIRSVAYRLGWTVAVHGSRRRDLDLIAVPWREDATDMEQLIKALHECVQSRTGWGHVSAERTPKPFGRIAVTILASAELNLDLSIIPLNEERPG